MFITAKTDEGDGDFDGAGETANDIIVGAEDELGVGVVGIELEDALVIVAGSDGIAEGGKPGALDEAGVEGELGARNSSGIKDFDVIGVAVEFGVFEFFGLPDELLHTLFVRRVGGTMGEADEAVIGVLAGIDGAHAVEFADEDGGQKMVDGEGIAGVAGEDGFEIRDGGFVVEVVESRAGSWV